jgi:hypothetical protein
MTSRTRALLAALYQPKAVEVQSADDGKPTHIVLGLWVATALVLLLPGRKKLDDQSILKAYSVTMGLFPLV